MLVNRLATADVKRTNPLAVNAGVLGAIGYYAYTEWDRPRWDKRIVSAVSVGLLTLWSGEGYVASLVGCT